MPTAAQRYLAIPPDYAKILGGLRWSESGDMIETAAGNPFAWRQQIQQFLEGFVSVRRPLHFVHILHLMQLMGVGPISVAAEPAADMRRSFLLSGKLLRNAGVFCAELCRDFAATSIDVSLSDLRQELSHQKPPVEIVDAEVPPVGPSDFLKQVFHVLSWYSAEEMLHWFKFGCAPDFDASRRVAEELQKRPPNLTDVLADAARDRERLTGALSLVPSLCGALALPPRRLDHSELPVGGYADVTTRGEPERLLPSQFAVDGVEFVRRFAEKELLYFRREEPFDSTREELVVLLDQGVRTWGGVRLALAGAAFALAQFAQRRKRVFLLATTGTGGEIIDPLGIQPSRLGDLLEASDLTGHPGVALERVLAEESERLRDIVILTHPRTLLQNDVLGIAGQHRDHERVFAVTVDSNGEGGLSEMGAGQPVSISRFRVDLAGALNPPKSTSVSGYAPDAWRGDVEPIPFPFWFGPMGDIQFVAIDQECQGLLVACANGMLHAQKLDGGAREVLPRGLCHSQVLRNVEDVLGVHGGFVVCGTVPNPAKRASFQLQSGFHETYRLDGSADSIPIAFHYDFRSRRAKAHLFIQSRTPPRRWVYFPDLHTIACFDGSRACALDLETGGFLPGPDDIDLTLIARARIAAARGGNHPFRILPRNSVAGQSVWRDFDSETGRLALEGLEPPWEPTVLVYDGEPILRDASIVEVQRAGELLAVHATLDRHRDRRVFLIRGLDSRLVREIVPHEHYPPMQLSGDGRLIAVKTNHNEVSVFAADGGAGAVAVMEPGACHSNVDVTAGSEWMHIGVGKCQHLFKWSGNAIVHDYSRGETDKFLLRNLSPQPFQRTVVSSEQAELTSSDPSRFKTFAGHTAGENSRTVRFVVDQFGHVVVLSADGKSLAAVIAVRRNKAAIWLPDGTRWGHPELAGPTTPGADERVARDLKAAMIVKKE